MGMAFGPGWRIGGEGIGVGALLARNDFRSFGFAQDGMTWWQDEMNR
jgi:hypothetical protein